MSPAQYNLTAQNRGLKHQVFYFVSYQVCPAIDAATARTAVTSVEVLHGVRYGGIAAQVGVVLAPGGPWLVVAAAAHTGHVVDDQIRIYPEDNGSGAIKGEIWIIR